MIKVPRGLQEPITCDGCSLCKESVSDTGFPRCRIMGNGPKPTSVMFVAEAPGSDEVDVGRGLVGRAGHFFDKELQDAGIPREQVFITNVVKCRPPGNRDPKPGEVAACLPLLELEIRQVRPAVIVLLGNLALRVLTELSGISQWQGQILFSWRYRCWIVPLIHPSGLMREQQRVRDEGKTTLNYLRAIDVLQVVWTQLRFRVKRVLKIEKVIAESVSQSLEIIQRLHGAEELAFDIEADSLNTRKAKPLGIGLCTNIFSGFYIPWRFVDQAVLNSLRQLFDQAKIKIAHNISYDRRVAERNGLPIGENVADTMLAHHLLDENLSHGLKEIEWSFLDKGGRADFLKPYYDSPIWPLIPDWITGDYCIDDVNSTFRLWKIFKPRLEEEKLTWLYENVTIPAVRVLEHMEDTGVYFDQVEMTKLKDRCEELSELAETAIWKTAGKEFNIRSGAQLGQVLFKDLGLPKVKKTAGGSDSTDEETLEVLKKVDKTGIVGHLLEYKAQQKILSTYIKGTYRRMSEDGRVHYEYLQIGTVTGRYSSAFHTWPHDPRIRRVVSAPPGYKIIELDGAQMELRIGACHTHDPVMIQEFRDGKDIHIQIAMVLFHCLADEVNEERRGVAKGFDFGVFYGRMAKSVADELHVSLAQAQRWIDDFFEKYHVTQDWIEGQKVFVHENLYVVSLFGRRRRLIQAISDDFGQVSEAERQAVNSPIQGTASDVVQSIFGCRVRKRILDEKLDARIFGGVHDSLLVYARDNIAPYTAEMMREEFEKPYPFLDVPMKADIAIVDHWYENKAG